MKISDIEYNDDDFKFISKLTKKQICNLFEVALYYSDEDIYFAMGFFPDPPCGDFLNDFDKETGNPGNFAREVLKDIVDSQKV